mmetsp:Transcript_9197/g.22789  ORF Transcript_9197/g.22789 Transcript_9197/m.22789 type:complete len:629 (+) Transcript_9197:234-2120(+)
MGSGNSKNKGKDAEPKAAAAPAATSKGGGDDRSAGEEHNSQRSIDAVPASPLLFASQTGQPVASIQNQGAAKSKKWQTTSQSPWGGKRTSATATTKLRSLQDPDASGHGAHRASLVSKMDPNLNQMDNAILMLEEFIQEKVQAGGLTTRERAKLDFVLDSFREMGVDEPGMDLSDEDEEIAEWLRADFMQTRARKTTDLKSRMKTVGLGVLAGKNLLKLKKAGPTVLPDLPFECENIEEERKILTALQGVAQWDWDIFKLREASGGRELQVMGWHFLCRWELPTKFNINLDCLRCWLDFVEDSYTSTEYHNSTHAADVLHGVFFMLTTCKVEKFLSEIEIMALLFAVMIHDLGHDGFNNAFHKNAMTDRSVRFNDQSIQENYHLYTFFKKLLADPSINIFDGMGPKQFASLRSTVIALLLQTDMSKHFTLQDSFKNLLEKHGKDPGNWGEDTQMLMGMVLHAVDIGAQAKSNAIALKWCALAHDEFFAQGDLERTKQMPISQCCDRDTTQINASQVGFISFIVKPTFVTIGRLFPNVEETCVPLCEANKQYYQSQVTPAASPRSPVGKLQSPKVAPMNPRLPAASLGASAMSESKKMKLGSELSIAEDGPPAPGREGRKLTDPPSKGD